MHTISILVLSSSAKFRERHSAIIVVTQLEMWFKKQPCLPVTEQAFKNELSSVRNIIRKQVWERAGVHLSEEVIVPLCDKWACLAHLLKLTDEKSEVYTKYLAQAQNALTENWKVTEVGDKEHIVAQLESLTCFSAIKEK